MFDRLYSKRQPFQNPPARRAPGGFVQPDVLLEDLGQRVPGYLADVDQDKLIHPACKRTLSDAAGDVASVWDHTRLEAIQYVMVVPGRDFGLLSAAGRQLEMIDGYRFEVDGSEGKEIRLMLPAGYSGVEAVDEKFVKTP